MTAARAGTVSKILSVPEFRGSRIEGESLGLWPCLSGSQVSTVKTTIHATGPRYGEVGCDANVAFGANDKSSRAQAM